MLRICFVVFVLILCRIPAHAETASETQYRQFVDLHREYFKLISSHIQTFAKYPVKSALRGDIGRVDVQFAIDPTGRVLDSRIIKPSCFDDIDKAALASVRTASPFPPFPSTLRAPHLTFVAPIMITGSPQGSQAVEAYEAKAGCGGSPPAKPAPPLLNAPPSFPPLEPVPPLLSPPPS